MPRWISVVRVNSKEPRALAIFDCDWPNKIVKRRRVKSEKAHVQESR